MSPDVIDEKVSNVTTSDDTFNKISTYRMLRFGP